MPRHTPAERRRNRTPKAPAQKRAPMPSGGSANMPSQTPGDGPIYGGDLDWQWKAPLG